MHKYAVGKYFLPIERLVLLVLAGVLLISCKKEPGVTPPIKADRTVLVYMAVSNLTSQAELNLADMAAGMEGLSGNLIVYVNR